MVVGSGLAAVAAAAVVVVVEMVVVVVAVVLVPLGQVDEKHEWLLAVLLVGH